MKNTLVGLLGSTFVALAAALVDSAAALADGGSDPTKIGDNLKSIVSPNAKAIWWVLLVAGVLFMAASRKASRAAATGIALVISGVVIYNPVGVGSMMQGFADRIF